MLRQSLWCSMKPTRKDQVKLMTEIGERLERADVLKRCIGESTEFGERLELMCKELIEVSGTLVISMHVLDHIESQLPKKWRTTK